MPFTKSGTPQPGKLIKKKGSCTKVKDFISKIPSYCTPTPVGEDIYTESQTGSFQIQNTNLHKKTAACPPTQTDIQTNACFRQ